jgi:DNA-binding NtrC family response regulator
VSEQNRVLVVDDDDGVREYVEAVLSRAGMEVVCAANGAHGMKALDERSPDLVLLDLAMPDASGLDLLLRIKELRGDLPVVMLSGQGEAANVVESIRRGAADFLAKPFEPEQLQVAVERALNLRGQGTICPTCNGDGWLAPETPPAPSTSSRSQD